MVQRHEGVADQAEVEQVPPWAGFRLFGELVVADHGRHRREVGEDHSSEDHETVLGDALPWRVADAEECRL